MRDAPDSTSDRSPPIRDGSVGARQVVVLALGVAATYLIGLLLWPFTPAIVTSAALAALVYPAHRRLEERVGHPDVAAFIGTTVLFFALLLPLVGLSFVLVGELRLGIDELTRQMSGMLAPGSGLREWLERAGGYVGLDPEQVSSQIGEQLQQVPSILADRTLSFLSGLGGWLLQAGTAVFTLYFMLRDGERLVEMIRWLIPLDPAYTDRLLVRAREVTYATMYGNVVVALVQGALVGGAFWVADLSAAALWGTITAVLSLLPVVGAPVVWAPAAVIMISGGRVGAGVAMFAFGALVVSTVDNWLRAVLVSDRAQLHPLVVFFSVLGAIFVFGAVGLFVGPVLFVVGLSLIETARLVLEPERPEGTAPEGERLLDRVSLGTFRTEPGAPSSSPDSELSDPEPDGHRN